MELSGKIGITKSNNFEPETSRLTSELSLNSQQTSDIQFELDSKSVDITDI